MPCDHLVRRLTDLGEGVVPDGESEALREHLRGCDGCAELQQDFENLGRLGRRLEAPSLPPGLRRRIEERIRQAELPG
jgi:hypothetical protein